jgi:tetratricopeptide (TPR) repeat protein
MKDIRLATVGAAIAGVVIIAGTLVYVTQPKAPPRLAPIAEASPAETLEMPPEMNLKRQEEQPAIAAADTPVPASPASPKAALSPLVRSLVLHQTGYSGRQMLLKQLKDSGELDEAIAELREMAPANPNDAQIPTALGEALLSKFPVQDYAEAVNLGEQIDQSFDAALALDPKNWEAQFYKADSMSYWPAEANKGPEVIQRLSSLVAQQETMPQQQQFAQTYLLLGEQYQKAGQAADAQSTWEAGLAKFPADATLQGKVNRLGGQ